MQIKGITRKFGEKKVLDELELEFKQDTINTIIAPNGTGKTTLLSIIAGFLKAESGEVVYDADATYKDVVMLLPGERNLYMKNTVYENLLFWGILSGYSKAQIITRIDKYQEIFSIYGNIKDCTVEKLSYGQKRLVALFSAIITDAKYIIVDEVSEGLDLENIRLLKRVLNEIKNDRIIILASQDYSFVADVSDYLFFLRNGKIEKTVSGIDNNQLIEIYQSLYMDGE